MHSRRQFLKTSAAVAAGSLLHHTSLRASIATLAQNSANGPIVTRLATDWEYLQGSLGGPWEAWHSEEVATWQPVAMPHCFNAYDGCDPDVVARAVALGGVRGGNPGDGAVAGGPKAGSSGSGWGNRSPRCRSCRRSKRRT